MSTAHATAPVQATHQSLATAGAEGKMRVLLAEDNIVNQKVAILMLKNGCRVDAVAANVEALEALTHIAYDLVFMDCQMPEMDGYEATTTFRAHEASGGTHVPIIAMTAYAMPDDRERCLQAAWTIILRSLSTLRSFRRLSNSGDDQLLAARAYRRQGLSSPL